MSLNLNKISDDLLICLWREKNEGAFELLLNRYTTFIYGFIKDFVNLNYHNKYNEFADFYQESFVCFLKCIDSYDEEKGYFYFFVKKSIQRTIILYINKLKRYQKIESIDEIMYGDGNESKIDYIAEDNYEYEDNALYNRLMRRINPVEKIIVDMRIDGYSYADIACELNITKCSVYRKVDKIKNILKDIMEKID